MRRSCELSISVNVRMDLHGVLEAMLNVYFR